ncbi:MAG: PEP-CTERM sorting domain-containing protein [Burkholderiales bacterium]|nr:PEP-CTERM sorting domain-containing protein [Burkholderiales bacterium]
MKLKHIVLASALAFGAVASATAATTLNIGQERTFDTEFVTNGPFTDTYDFIFGFTGPGEVQGSISELRFRNAKDIVFGVGAVKVFDAANNLLFSADGPGTTGSTSFFEIALGNNPLVIPTQSFSVVISGNVVGTGQVVNGVSTRGSYDFSIQAAPVPEPETYALMLGGLGAIGFMLRRRAAK